MHISAISSDYSQVMRTWSISNSCGKDKFDTNALQSEQKENMPRTQLYAAIVEWQRFCQQQILKQNLDVIV